MKKGLFTLQKGIWSVSYTQAGCVCDLRSASVARPLLLQDVWQPGCAMRPQSTPWKAPASTSRTLPPPPSSAGVPTTVT